MEENHHTHRVVAVYPDERTANSAASAARAAGASGVEVGAHKDHIGALVGEMHDDAAKPGFFTPKMIRALPYWTVLGALVGGVAVLPFALGDNLVASFAGDVGSGVRLLMIGSGACMGALFGFVLGVIVSGELFGKRRLAEGKLAAERGVVVGAEETTVDITSELGARDPIRMDRVAPDGQPKETLIAEEPRDALSPPTRSGRGGASN